VAALKLSKESIKGAQVSVDENKVDPNELNSGAETEQELFEGTEAESAEPGFAEGSSETGGQGGDSSDSWQQKALALEVELASLKDAAIRAQAEAQNVRRRAELDVEKAHKFALEKFVKELLPVIDGLEKTVEAEQQAGNEVTPLREGVDMTLSMLLAGITKFGVEQIDPIGKVFDPTLHEAMTMIDVPGAEPNTVIDAMQRGYTLHGRLVRPAMVVVAK
jgi:molecular chaperone GrpE